MAVKYYFNGIDLRTYHVRVSKGKGLLLLPDIKKEVSHSYDNEHGIMMSSGRCYVKERQITLSCFTEKMTHDQFLTTMNTLKLLLLDAGTAELRVEIDGSQKPLVYKVRLSGKSDVSPNYEGSRQVGTFDLVLTEPQPVKRVIKVITTAANKSLTVAFSGGSRYWTIWWGDGTSGLATNGDTLSHTYSAAGTYYAMVCGEVDGLTTTLTNDSNMTTSTIWNRLL